MSLNRTDRLCAGQGEAFAPGLGQSLGRSTGRRLFGLLFLAAFLAFLIDETVRATRKFLAEHPEEVKKLGCSMGHAKAQGIGRAIVSEFLGWDKTRVLHSLERLGLIDEGIVEPEAIRALAAGRLFWHDQLTAIPDRSAAVGARRRRRLHE